MTIRSLTAERARASVAALLLVALLVLPAACGGEGAGTGTGAGTIANGMQISVTTDPDPPKAGPVTVIVRVKDADGKAVDDARVSLSTSMPTMGHGGMEGELVSQGEGRYSAAGSFSMSGLWRLDVQVAKDGMETQSQTFDMQVR